MIAYNKTITKPLPGPVIVNCEPPKTATTVPPTIEAITPEIGGASEAMARPNPSGNATNDTTNPANKFLGTSFIKSFIIYYFQFFIIRTSVGNSDKICSISFGKILEIKEDRFVSEFRTSKSARTTLA